MQTSVCLYILNIVGLYGFEMCITLRSVFSYDFKVVFLYGCTICTSVWLFSLTWRNSPSGSRPTHYRGLTITLRRSTLDRTPMVKQPARCRYLYLTTHNTHKRQNSMPEVGFKPAIPASHGPHTHALDHAATGIGYVWLYGLDFCMTVRTVLLY
jgi:hypothetical protein